MRCDSCGDEIGSLGGDWVALGNAGDICTVCAAEEIEKLRAEVERLREFKEKVLSSVGQIGASRDHALEAAVAWLMQTEAGGADRE